MHGGRHGFPEVCNRRGLAWKGPAMRGLVSFWVDLAGARRDCRLVAAILRTMVSPAVKVIRELGVGRWGLTRARPAAREIEGSRSAVRAWVTALFAAEVELRKRVADVARRMTEISAEPLWPLRTSSWVCWGDCSRRVANALAPITKPSGDLGTSPHHSEIQATSAFGNILLTYFCGKVLTAKHFTKLPQKSPFVTLAT